MAGTTQSCGYDCGNKKHLKLKEEAFRLQEMGWLQKDISKEVGISQGTCSVWLKEMNGGKSGRVHWRTNHSISAQHGPVG
jgi:orotate phosphoribosyltransferase-like protein